MTGSTLYRRLPDGTWASEREDLPEESPVAMAAAAGMQPAGGPAAAAGPADPAGPVSGPAPIAAPPPPPLAQPRRRRRWSVRRVLLWAALAYVAWLCGLMVYFAVSLQKTPALSPDPIPDTPGQVWLLVGSDSRAGLSRQERAELRTGSDEGQRTDTIMLLHMQAGQAPTLVSIPRDSWVTIPAHSSSSGASVPARKGKINAAFSFGGAPLLSETIEYNTGLHVDHYMEVGMGGIVQMTNAVGGIGVCFDQSISDRNSGLDVQAGCQTLDGAQSLAWVRMRYADPKGDLGRIERQQKYVSLVLGEILSWQTLVNPLRQLRIVNAVLDSVLVDEGSGVVDLGRLGVGMARVFGGSGEVTTVPTDDTDHWAGGQWVLKWDTPKADALFASIGGQTPPVQAGAP